MSYKKILASLDGSECSNIAIDAALSLVTKTDSSELIGCHVYAANLHRTRFSDMEPGLPGDYRGEKLDGLRKTHEDLIGEGLRMISNAYLDPLAKRASSVGVKYKSVTPEGRNYIEILKATRDELPELIVIGGHGQGQAPFLGSTAERVLLYSQESDILVVRRPWKLNGGKIAVGIDGSESSFLALKKALDISISHEDVDVRAISVYDPFFHSEVFKNISSTLGDKAKEHFDLQAQERIHDEVIDEGLERLYNNGLNEGIEYAKSVGKSINPKILAGKILAQITKYVSDEEIDLLVLGRWGLHREEQSLIGSNALNIARLSKINVLVMSSSPLQKLDDKGPAKLRFDPQY